MTKYAISTPNVGDPAWLVELARSVERAGWDAFFLWDHMHLVRDLALDVFDPWVTLGAVARETERVRVGTMVTPVPRRRPWKLAKEVVTVDHLSGGRITLGVGLGEPAADEFAAFGEPTGLRDRAVLLDEGLALLDRFPGSRGSGRTGGLSSAPRAGTESCRSAAMAGRFRPPTCEASST